jgi:hypothetical protein
MGKTAAPVTVRKALPRSFMVPRCKAPPRGSCWRPQYCGGLLCSEAPHLLPAITCPPSCGSFLFSGRAVGRCFGIGERRYGVGVPAAYIGPPLRSRSIAALRHPAADGPSSKRPTAFLNLPFGGCQRAPVADHAPARKSLLLYTAIAGEVSSANMFVAVRRPDPGDQ